MGEKAIEYLFVYDGQQWWLKLTEADQIADYHKKTAGSRYEGAINLYRKLRQEGRDWHNLLDGMELQERIKMMESKDFKYIQCAIIKAQQIEGTIFDGFRCLNMEIGMAQLDNIKQYGAVFINPAGGHTHGVETVQFCRRKQLVFPDFKKEDIRVRKFNGGQHWYAYIGDMQVRDGDRLKWNTKDAAQAAAEALVTEQEEEKFLNGWDGSKCIYYTDEKCLYFNDSEAPCHHCTHYTE